MRFSSHFHFPPRGPAVIACALLALAGCADNRPPEQDTDTGAPNDTDEPADTDEPDTDEPEGLAIVGTWTDDWGTQHHIDEALWKQVYPNGDDERYHLLDHDNAARWVVARNDEANPWNPELYSRFDWLRDGDVLHVCQSVFDAEDADAARQAAPADPEDLDGGCGGFSWSTLTR